MAFVLHNSSRHVALLADCFAGGRGERGGNAKEIKSGPQAKSIDLTLSSRDSYTANSLFAMAR
jgi:hypothetical protein